jgi:hypothetical protein
LWIRSKQLSLGDLGRWKGGNPGSEVAIEDVKHIAVGDLVKLVSVQQSQKGIVLSFIEDHSFFDTKVLWENGTITSELAFSLIKVIK